MLLQSEDASVIRADAFENTVPIQQPVVKNRNLRVLLVVILTVDKNLHFRARSLGVRQITRNYLPLLNSKMLGALTVRFPNLSFPVILSPMRIAIPCCLLAPT